MRLNALQVGEDGRNDLCSARLVPRPEEIVRLIQSIYSVPSVWLRGLIKPKLGHAVAYIDWGSQEVGIAAAVSGNLAMQSDYQSGDESRVR